MSLNSVENLPCENLEDPYLTASSNPVKVTADVLVIGWGKGGKTLAAKMAARGKNVVIVERDAKMYGGTCINIACVPTKTLIHSASEKREAGDAQEFFSQAVAYRDKLIGKLNDVNFHMLADKESVKVIDGQARFIGPKMVEVLPSSGAVGAPTICTSQPRRS